jgi:hypothetical protein
MDSSAVDYRWMLVGYSVDRFSIAKGKVMSRYESGCYKCQMGDPHTIHQTPEEFYGIGTEAPLPISPQDAAARKQRKEEWDEETRGWHSL